MWRQVGAPRAGVRALSQQQCSAGSTKVVDCLGSQRASTCGLRPGDGGAVESESGGSKGSVLCLPPPGHTEKEIAL